MSEHAPDQDGHPDPPGRSDDRWRWVRRGLMLGALVAAVAFVVVTLQKSPESSSHPDAATDPAVRVQKPAPGSHVIRQSQVGVELLPGYDGRLTIEGTRIPEDQMDGAVPSDSPTYDPRQGVRPNNKYQVFFTPGPGKVIDRYSTGEVDVTVRFWRIEDGPKNSTTISWAFFVN